MTRTRPALALLTSLALLMAGCGDDEDDVATTEPTPTSETTTTAPAREDTAVGATTVEVASSDLGEILVSDGRTLYVFTPDDAGPSTCSGQCAETWPPLVTTDDVTAGANLDQALLGTAPRDDGAEQVTVDGWPLYFFARDAEPGDVNGQGVGGNWWVVGPDGQPIEEG